MSYRQVQKERIIVYLVLATRYGPQSSCQRQRVVKNRLPDRNYDEIVPRGSN